MSGTQPFTEFGTHTVVRLTAGLSKTAFLKFPWGAPVEPVTVGVRGHWAVLADGLQDTHLYLGFDGRQLLIALGSPDAQVMLNGQPLQTRGWFRVPVPGHIQMAGGELRVENEGPAPDLLRDASSLANSSIDTLFDGGVLRERGRVVVEQTPAPLAQQSSPPPAAGGRDVPWAPRDAPVAIGGAISAGPSDRGRRKTPPPESLQAKRTPASSLPPGATSTPPPPASRGFWREASGPKKLSIILMPFALASMFWVIWDDDDGAGAGTSPARKASVAVSTASSVAVSTAAPSTEVVVRPTLARTPPTPSSATPGVSAAGGASAATPSAATPSAATPSAATPSAATPSAANPSAAASTAAKPDAAALAATAPLPDTKGFSPRTAFNAAFLGDWAEATKQYAALASAYPDNEAFRLAVRLTADHAVRRP